MGITEALGLKTGDVTGVNLDTGEIEKAELPYMLDTNDEFEKLLVDIAEMNRKKRADYGQPQNNYMNIDRAATQTALPPLDVCDVMVAVKNGRIANLRGRSASNEHVRDTYLDRALYAIFAYGLYLRDYG
jgi:hypothetical protein